MSSLSSRPARVLVLGVGSFAQSTMRILREAGAEVSCYLTRDYARWSPSLEGKVFDSAAFPSPVSVVQSEGIDLAIPMSIDWAQKPWAEALLRSGARVLCAHGEGLRIERERDFARMLCEGFGVPFARSFFAGTRTEARKIVEANPGGYVLKNPLCGPGSPLHTIVCEDLEETLSWIRAVDDREGIFLQEYLGRAEAGHIALVAGGEIHSLVTNQEYKRAFHGNQGIVAGAPLGGLVEADAEDRYGLAAALLRPLLPWFREIGFAGPIQVTALKAGGKWHVVEYNVRLGVTSGAMILRMLEDPLGVLSRAAANERIEVRFRKGEHFGCSVTLAGYGYPYTQVAGPDMPVRVDGGFTGDVWWNEARGENGKIVATGHRIADVVALGSNLADARQKAYENIARIKCLGSYYREDVGESLWPPGTV